MALPELPLPVPQGRGSDTCADCRMVPAFKPMAPAATSLVATAVIVTSILVPILTSIWSRKVKARAAKIEILGTVK